VIATNEQVFVTKDIVAGAQVGVVRDNVFDSESNFRGENRYPEHVDKYISDGEKGYVSGGGKLGRIVGWLNERGYEKEAKGIAVCGGTVKAVELRCHDNHRYARQIFCGRQYCPRCGEKDSLIHQRRYSRVWDKLMWAPALGKVVLTIPEELRDDFKSKKMLGKLHRLGWECVKEVLGQELDIDGGMTTVHLFGDAEGQNGGKSDKFHPHVNITFPLCSDAGLVDEDGRVTKESVRMLVSKEALKALRDKWFDVLEKLTGKTISLTKDGRERKNAHYGFRVTEAQKAHWLKYVLRPTVGAKRFLRLDDDLREFVVSSLVGFHNVRWYGKLSNRNFREYKENYLEHTLFYQEFITGKQQGNVFRDLRYCPICYGRLKAYKPRGKVKVLWGIHKTWREIAGGMWCDEATYQTLVDKGLIGADGKYSGSSP